VDPLVARYGEPHSGWPHMEIDEPDWEQFERVLSLRVTRTETPHLHVALAQVLASSAGRARLTQFMHTATPNEWLRLAGASSYLMYFAANVSRWHDLPKYRPDLVATLEYPTRAVANVAQEDDALAVGLASTSLDGYVRERAVRRLAQLADPLAAPFLVLRVLDIVPATAALAETSALDLARRDPAAFELAARAVSALHGRKRMAGFAAEFYGIAASDVTRQIGLLGSLDSATSRAGLELALRARTLPLYRLMNLARHSSDARLSARAARAVIGALPPDDPNVLRLIRQGHKLELATPDVLAPDSTRQDGWSDQQPMAGPKAMALVFDPDDATRWRALADLGRLRYRPAVAMLVKFVRQRRMSLLELEGIGTSPLDEAVYRLWTDADHAVTALGKIGDRRAVRPLVDCLDVALLCGTAIKALDTIHDRRAVEPLIACFERDHLPFLATILGKWGDRRALAPLIEAMEDDDALVRYYVARALGRLGDQGALPILTRAVVNDGGPVSVNGHIISGLGGKSVADAARWAIDRIETGS